MPHHKCLECSMPFYSAYLPKGKPSTEPLCPSCSFRDERFSKAYEDGFKILKDLNSPKPVER